LKGEKNFLPPPRKKDLSPLGFGNTKETSALKHKKEEKKRETPYKPTEKKGGTLMREGKNKVLPRGRNNGVAQGAQKETRFPPTGLPL